MAVMRYFLDTNVLSLPLMPRPNQLVVERMLRAEDESATGAPVVHELAFGYERLDPSGRRQIYQDFVRDFVLAKLRVLPYDAKAAMWHAAERARLRQLGLTPPTARRANRCHCRNKWPHPRHRKHA